jgi:hypothetical protein
MGHRGNETTAQRSVASDREETERPLDYRIRSKTCVEGPWTRGGAARRGQRHTERPPRLEDGVSTDSNENKSCQTYTILIGSSENERPRAVS